MTSHPFRIANPLLDTVGDYHESCPHAALGNIPPLEYTSPASRRKSGTLGCMKFQRPSFLADLFTEKGDTSRMNASLKTALKIGADADEVLRRIEPAEHNSNTTS
jgi:hypothetical protein